MAGIFKRILMLAVPVLPVLLVFRSLPVSAAETEPVSWKDRIAVSGYAQVGWQYDSYDLVQSGPFNRFNLYRAMLIARVEPVRNWSVGFMGDVAAFRLHELFVEYRPSEAFGIRLGQYKTPYTLESNMSPSVLEIIRSAQPVAYLAGLDGSDACFGPGAGRDLGLMASGFLFPSGPDGHRWLEYRIGLFNGRPYNQRETDNRKDFSAMLGLSPVPGIKIVGTVYLGQATAMADSPYGAFRTGDAYRRNRWSAGVDLRYGPLYLRSEYLEGLDADVRSRGVYATFTGSLGRGVDLILSWDWLDRNTAVHDAQQNYIVGMQWNFWKKCRIQAQYVYQHREAGEGGVWAGVPSSHLFITQLQVGF